MILQRTHFLERGIFGVLLDNNRIEVCKTLEHAFPAIAGRFIPAVTCGTYLCQRSVHKLPQKIGEHDKGKTIETFQVMNVPCHTGILFHTGNFNEDSAGCILLGLGIYAPADKYVGICDSRKAFDAFMAMHESDETFSLWVTNDAKLPEHIA